MTYETLFSRCTFLDCDRVVPNRVAPIEHVTLGEAIDLRHRDACGQGRISEESFQKIRDFRAKMAEYDKQWGRK
ncbi:MAG: hypothetical protein PHD48_00155 [Alphaproteobacteria bacterium]|nr:hypothetical protein [Alphaproteobacteria bacterium]